MAQPPDFARKLVEGIPDAIVHADAQGLIQVWNHGAERIFGFTAAEAIGQSLDIIIPERLRKRHWDGYHHTMATGLSQHPPEELLSVPAQTKAGEPLSIQFTVTPVRDETNQIAGIVAAYAHAARCALDAGFDGVEVHAANGYLIDQFLRDSINDRDDAWGGSIENRTRLFAEVVHAVAQAVGPGRTGLRLSPGNPGNGAPLDSTPQASYGRAVERIAPLKLAYLHVIEGQTRGDRAYGGFDYAALRAVFGGPWMVNNGYDRALALDTVAAGGADLVAFGRPFIGNPDLGRRLREGLPWADSDRSLYYASGPRGYSDYPTLPLADG